MEIAHATKAAVNMYRRGFSRGRGEEKKKVEKFHNFEKTKVQRVQRATAIIMYWYGYGDPEVDR